MISRRSIALGGVILVLSATVFIAIDSPILSFAPSETVDAVPPEIREFDAWMTEQAPEPGSTEQDRQSLTEGIRLAQARASVMRALMRTDPDAALDAALGYAEYARLPAEIQAIVEEPFSEVASLYVHIACDPGHSSKMDYQLETVRQERYRVFLPSDERLHLSKRNLPLQGIRLDELAVVRGDVFQKLEGDDFEYARNQWPAGQTQLARSFLTGQPIQGAGLWAVAGGRIYHFQNEAELQQMEATLSQADQLPGLDVGSQWITRELAANGFPAEQFSQETQSAAYSSTTGDKTAFFIRVEFPDLTGTPVAASSLEGVIDLEVNDALAEYSYGATSMDATIYGSTVQVDDNSGDYLGDIDDDDIQDTPKNASDLYEEAITKYMTAVGTATDPRSVYDTVGIYIDYIGYSWGGLASVGGQRMWIQDSLSSSLILHEFGHNYGLSHANYWVFDATNGTSTDPVDPTGASQEYGDDFDVMGNGSTADGHFHMGAKQFLGWIESGEWDDLSSGTDNGTYRIFRFDNATGNGLQALRISKSDTSDHYWVGYRKEYQDLPAFESGAYLTWERADGNTSRNQSWLVDTTPGSTDGKDDAPITLGRTYADTASEVYLTPVALGGTAPEEYIDLVVNFGPFPGNTVPTGTISGPGMVEARQLVLFSASVTDAEGDPLAYAWDVGDGQIQANSPTLTHSWNSAGTYEIALTVSDMKGGSVDLTQTVEVNDPLDTWSTRTSGTTKELFAIAASSTHVIAAGDDGTILRSPDGETWTIVSPSGFIANLRFYDLAWTGSEFVAVGYDYDFDIVPEGWEGVIYTSPDGQTWTRAYETNTADTELRGIAFDGSSTLVAVGENATVLRKSGADAWTPISTSVTGTHVLQDIAYGDRYFVFVGHDTISSYSGDVALFRSSDGLSWEDLSANTGLDSWKDFSEIEYLEGAFYAGGFYAQPRRSTDAGQSWSTTVTGDRYEVDGFASIDGLVYAVGRNRDDAATNADLISSDGINWTVTDPRVANYRNELIDFNQTFISVGEGGTIRQSSVISNSEGYDNFAVGYFPGGGSDAEAVSNPDFDWANNLIEYALGGNPDLNSDAPAQPNLTFDASGHAVFEIMRDAKQQDVAYSVWWSLDLQTWTQAGLTVIENTATSLKVRTDQSFGAQSKAFFRLRLDR